MPSGMDQHQFVHASEPVAGRFIGDGTKGGIPHFRGVNRPTPAQSDKDATGCPAVRHPMD